MEFNKIRNLITYDELSQYINKLKFNVYNFGYLDYGEAFQKDNILANYKLVAIEKGDISLHIGRYQVQLHKGDIALIPPFTPFQLNSSTPTQHFYLHFDPQSVDDRVLLASMFPKRFHVTTNALQENDYTYLHSINNMIQLNSTAAYALVINVVYYLIILINRFLAKERSLNISLEANAAYTYVTKSLIIVDQHLDTNISINQLCEQLGITPNYLNQCYQQIFHCSTKHFVDMYRFHHIESEVLQTDISISDIAYKYGYGSVYAFSNAFKKIYKTSPSNYRKKHGYLTSITQQQ